MDILTVAIDCMILGLVGWIAYEGIMAVYRTMTLRYEVSYDTARVISKTELNDMSLRNASIPYPIGINDQQEIFVAYEGRRYCLVDRGFYHNIRIGQEVPVRIKKGYNSQGELKHTIVRLAK